MVAVTVRRQIKSIGFVKQFPALENHCMMNECIELQSG